MRKALEISIIGTSSATPMKYRHPSAQFVRLEVSYLLLDCGVVTQRQMLRYGFAGAEGFSYVYHLFYGDHYFGLPGLITSMALCGRTEPLVIFGPPELESIMQVLITESDSVLPYEKHYIDT